MGGQRLTRGPALCTVIRLTSLEGGGGVVCGKIAGIKEAKGITRNERMERERQCRKEKGSKRGMKVKEQRMKGRKRSFCEEKNSDGGRKWKRERGKKGEQRCDSVFC